MTDSFSKFEQTLRQFKPTPCDERLPETFYQAGWEACEKARTSIANSVTPVTVSKASPVQSFGTGLLCGVLASVGISALGLWQGGLEPSERIVSQYVIKRESVVADDRDGDVESAKAAGPTEAVQPFSGDAIMLPDWHAITSVFSPWTSLPARFSASVNSPSTLPLSVAAREQWTFIAATQSSIPLSVVDREVSTVQDAKKKDLMSTSPITEAWLRELL